MGTDSPLEIRLGSTFDPGSRTGDLTVTITAVEPISHTNLKLRIAIIENDIEWQAPNGGIVHNQTFRDMIPSVTGEPIVIEQGETIEFSTSFACPEPLIPENCEIIAFVQSDENRRILQGAKIAVGEAPEYCDYVIGDYNGNEEFNVADIISAFSKLRTGSPDPAYVCECPYASGNEWAVAMDVNNSCVFNVVDIIAALSSLQTGSPDLIPCEDCPPSGWEPVPRDYHHPSSD